MKRKLAALFLALTLTLGLAAPALAAETATLIRLTKTTGTVEISKSSGKSVPLLKNMRLYNGYHVSTDEESYAWINLDDSKLNKQDAESEVEVRKDGKKLEVLLCSGNLFFDVAEPLEDDESMNIRTSTTAVGIRGTSGWVECVDRWTTRVSVLEGTVECSVADPVTGQIKAEEVRGGESVLCVVYPQEKTGDKSAILRDKLAVDDIPGFVLTDLTRDMALCDKIEAATGLDIPRDLASVAGGDPSGRTPDREHATKEVLGESDRREDADEDALHEKLEEIEKELEKQPGEVSPSKPIEKPAPTPSDKDSDRDSGGDSGGSTTPAPAPPEPTPVTYTVTFHANGGEWSGATERTVQTAADGTVTLPEAPTRSGYSFSGWYDAPEGGTELPEGSVFTADAAVYAHWTENAPLPPPTYTVTFDANGGTPSSSLQTDTDGNLASFPAAPTYPDSANPQAGSELTFLGWFDANGVEYTPSSSFGADTTLYAYWDGWYLDAGGTLTVARNYSSSTSSIPWSANRADINKVVIKNNATYIGDFAFANCASLTSVAIPDSVTGIEYEAFSNCTSLTSVTIPDSVTFIGAYAFQYCSSLTSINIPDSVTYIGGHAFYYCRNLTKVIIPDSVKSIESYVFNGCTNLTSVVIPASVTSIGSNAFANCSSLTSVDIPDNVTSIGSYAFYRCSGLTSLTIPNSVTSIGELAFGNCASLASVTIPEGVTSIGYAAFGGCASLTSVVIPNSVTIIELYAFENCTNMTEVTIPAGVTSIGINAFNGCTNLTTVNFGGTRAAWETLTVDKNTGIPADVTVNCADDAP